MSLLHYALYGLSVGGSKFYYESIDTNVAEIEPAHQLPDGGLLVTSNHSFHMFDSIALMNALNRSDVYFLAYSTLYKGLLLGFWYKRLQQGRLRSTLERLEDTIRLSLLRGAHMIPLNREKDGRGDFGSQRENFTYFDEAAALIAQGHVVVVYPDGGSPDGYNHADVKAGAALLALQAASMKNAEVPIHLLRAGITYSSFYEPLHSSVQVQFASPISLEDWAPVDKKDARRKRKLLTPLIQEGIRSNMAFAPLEHTRAVELISALLKDEEPELLTRTRRASSIIEELSEAGQWCDLEQELVDYDQLAHQLKVPPGTEVELPDTPTLRSRITGLCARVGEWLFGFPGTLSRKLTQSPPTLLHLRGYRSYLIWVLLHVVWITVSAGITEASVVYMHADALLVWPCFGSSLGLGFIASRNWPLANFYRARAAHREQFESYLLKSAQLRYKLLYRDEACEEGSDAT